MSKSVNFCINDICFTQKLYATVSFASSATITLRASDQLLITKMFLNQYIYCMIIFDLVGLIVRTD